MPTAADCGCLGCWSACRVRGCVTQVPSPTQAQCKGLGIRVRRRAGREARDRGGSAGGGGHALGVDRQLPGGARGPRAPGADRAGRSHWPRHRLLAHARHASGAAPAQPLLRSACLALHKVMVGTSTQREDEKLSRVPALHFVRQPPSTQQHFGTRGLRARLPAGHKLARLRECPDGLWGKRKARNRICSCCGLLQQPARSIGASLLFSKPVSAGVRAPQAAGAADGAGPAGKAGAGGITGTSSDLRRLSMPQAKQILMGLGVAESEINGVCPLQFPACSKHCRLKRCLRLASRASRAAAASRLACVACICRHTCRTADSWQKMLPECSLCRLFASSPPLWRLHASRGSCVAGTSLTT